MSSKAIILDGEPFMIKQTSKGVFRAVRSATSYRRKEKEFMRFFYAEDIEELIEGEDLYEMPSRDLAINVEVPRGARLLEYVLLELRKFADITSCDYFSYEPFGHFICLHVTSDDRIETYKARPRIFRKIVND